MVDAALAHARKKDMSPLAVVVLDARGVLKFAAAEDGTSLKRAEIATGKAHGALAMGLGSRTLHTRVQKQPYFIAAVTHAVGGLMVPVPGGVLDPLRPTANSSAPSAYPATTPTTMRKRPWPASPRSASSAIPEPEPMPELPEVETVRRGLEPVLVGQKIVRVEQRRADLRIPFPGELRQAADRPHGRDIDTARQVPPRPSR